MNKIVILILSLLCTAVAASAQVFPVVANKVSGDQSNRINIVILPDGFTSAELPDFQLKTDTVQKAVFLQTPMKEYADFFNVYSINVPSAQSGCDHPGTATDVTEPVIPVLAVNTYFSCTFDNAGTHRALVCSNKPAALNVLAVNLPAFDQILMIANSFEYGGTGGQVATLSRDDAAIETALHELGHSFAGLADEYWAGFGFAAEKANMTSETDTAVVKWHNWLRTNGVLHYPYGTTSPDADWFRPHQNCKMQFLNRAFCRVCQEAFIDRIYSLVTPVDSTWPDATTIVNNTTGAPATFKMKLIKPKPNTLKIKWQLNSTFLESTDTTVTISNNMWTPGTNALTAYITDTTKLSRSYLPGAGYEFSVVWNVNQLATGVITIEPAQDNGRFFYKLYPIPAKTSITLAYDNHTSDASAYYTLTDVSGRTIKKGELQLQQGKHDVQINTEGMPPGVYILTLNGKTVYMSEQVIIQ